MAFSDFSLDIPSEIVLNLSGELSFKGNIKASSSSDARISRIAKELESNKGSTRELADILDTVLKEAISSSVWATRNGTDDIIDSGQLLNSGTVNTGTNGISINYDVPYAALIHYGGYIVPYGNTDATRVYIPPRPWVTTVLGGQFRGFDPKQAYRAIILRILQSL